MSDLSDRFLNAVHELQAVADSATPEDVRKELDEATLQVFWRDWPHVSSWTGGLWRALSEDLEQASRAPESDLDDVGGEGG